MEMAKLQEVMDIILSANCLKDKMHSFFVKIIKCIFDL